MSFPVLMTQGNIYLLVTPFLNIFFHGHTEKKLKIKELCKTECEYRTSKSVSSITVHCNDFLSSSRPHLTFSRGLTIILSPHHSLLLGVLQSPNLHPRASNIPLHVITHAITASVHHSLLTDVIQSLHMVPRGYNKAPTRHHARLAALTFLLTFII